MFSYATKVLTALTGSALVAALVFGAVVSDHVGVVLMLAVALAALVAIVVVVASGVFDVAPYIPADAPAPERRAHTPGEPGRASGWPAAAAASLAVLAVGAATSAPVLDAGVILLVLSAVGWFTAAWRDHPSWTGRVSTRVTNRFVAPFGTPVLGGVLLAVIAISISRVLLASDEKIAPLIALVVALVVLLGFFWIASRPRLTSSVLIGLSAIAGVALVGAGVAGASQGERHFEEKSPIAAPIKIVAKNVSYQIKAVEAPADKTVTIEFVNEDAGIYHNVAVYTSDKPDASPIFNGQGIPGRRTAKYTLQTPGPGTYTFRCDFHANMVGTFTVGGG